MDVNYNRSGDILRAPVVILASVDPSGLAVLRLELRLSSNQRFSISIPRRQRNDAKRSMTRVSAN